MGLLLFHNVVISILKSDGQGCVSNAFDRSVYMFIGILPKSSS